MSNRELETGISCMLKQNIWGCSIYLMTIFVVGCFRRQERLLQIPPSFKLQQTWNKLEEYKWEHVERFVVILQKYMLCTGGLIPGLFSLSLLLSFSLSFFSFFLNFFLLSSLSSLAFHLFFSVIFLSLLRTLIINFVRHSEVQTTNYTF